MPRSDVHDPVELGEEARLHSWPGRRGLCQAKPPLHIEDTITDRSKLTRPAECSLPAEDGWRAGLREGLRESLPVAAAYVAFGLAFGVMARQVGLSVLDVFLLSGLVYSGATQFAIIGLLAVNAPIGAMLLAGGLLTLRHTLMGASIAPYLSGLDRWRKAILAFGLTDESFALSIARFRLGGAQISYQAVTSALLYLTWFTATIVGVVLGHGLDDPSRLGLDFAFAASFIGLVLPGLRLRIEWTVAILAVAITVIGNALLPANLGLVAAGLLAPLLGVLLEGEGDRHDD